MALQGRRGLDLWVEHSILGRIKWEFPKMAGILLDSPANTVQKDPSFRVKPKKRNSPNHEMEEMDICRRNTGVVVS